MGLFCKQTNKKCLCIMQYLETNLDITHPSELHLSFVILHRRSWHALYSGYLCLFSLPNCLSAYNLNTQSLTDGGGGRGEEGGQQNNLSSIKIGFFSSVSGSPMHTCENSLFYFYFQYFPLYRFVCRDVWIYPRVELGAFYMFNRCTVAPCDDSKNVLKGIDRFSLYLPLVCGAHH